MTDTKPDTKTESPDDTEMRRMIHQAIMTQGQNLLLQKQNDDVQAKYTEKLGEANRRIGFLASRAQQLSTEIEKLKLDARNDADVLKYFKNRNQELEHEIMHLKDEILQLLNGKRPEEEPTDEAIIDEVDAMVRQGTSAA